MADLRLAGVTFPNPDGTHRQKILGELYDSWWTEGREAEIVLELRPEEDNPHDANAVAVYASVPGWDAPQQIGYVEAKDAPLVRRALARDLVGRVYFRHMNTGSRGAVAAKFGIARK